MPLYGCLLTHTSSFLWDSDKSEFVDVSESERASALEHCEWWSNCYSCGRKVIKKQQALWKSIPDGGISRLGIAYHVHDFVYLRPSKAGELQYKIAQIVEIFCNAEDQCELVRVRPYGRYDDLLRSSKGDEQVKMDDV